MGLCTFAWLNGVIGPFPIHGDAVRDQLLVRDCIDLGRCHLLGAPSSIRGPFYIFHGAVWLELLTAVRLLGGDTTTQVTVVLALNALAAALTFIVVWRWLHPALALPAGYLLAEVLAGDRSANMLVNGSASALFNVMTAAGVLCYGLSNRTRFLLISAFAAALAVNIHVAAATLIPAILIVIALGPTPDRAVSAAATLFVAVCLATSGTALWANGVAIGGRWLVFVILLAAMLVVVAATTCGPLFRRLSAATRASVIAGILILPFVFGSLWLVFIEKHFFEARYFHPIFGPMAVLTAAIVCAPFQWLAKRARWLPWVPSILSLCLLTQHVSGGFSPPGPPPTWTPTDATKIGLEAAKRGFAFEDLAFRLQAEDCGRLLLGIAMEGPRLGGEPPADDLQLQVKTVQWAATPTTNERAVVPLATGRFGILHSVHSWLRPYGTSVCRRAMDPTVPPSCRPLADPREIHSEPDEARRMVVGGGEFSFESRVALSHEFIDVPQPYVTSYRIPVLPVAGQIHELRLADHGVDGCRWQFVHADGLRIQNDLPATYVRVEGDSDGPGELLIEKVFGAPACPAHEMEYAYPPCVLETSIEGSQ